MKRRKFIKTTGCTGAALSLSPSFSYGNSSVTKRALTKGLRATEKYVTFSGYDGPGIVVEYDGASRLIFWENAQYIPCWDLGGDLWSFNQWVETSSPDNGHCYEPMMDMENRYTNASIRVNGPARTIVHWNYALCDNQYRIFNGNTTADEYYTTYPDGITVRRVVCWPGNESAYGGNGRYWEIGEWNILMGKGVTPQDVVANPALVFRNIKGESFPIEWPSPVDSSRYLCEIYPQVADWSEYIGILNMKGRPKSYAVIPMDQMLFPHVACGYCGKMHVHSTIFGKPMVANHWPIYEKDDWVGWKNAHDQVGKTVSNIGFGGYSYAYNHRWKDTPAGQKGHYQYVRPPRPTTWLSLNGVTDKDEEYIAQVAASWLNPARVNAPGWVFEGFNYSQKAYVFRPIDRNASNFKVDIVPKASALNPVIVIEGFAKPVTGIKLNGVDFENFTAQTEHDRDTVVWIGENITNTSSIDIFFN